MPKQQKVIEEVKETLGMDDNVARTLLLKYLWNKESLIQQYFDNENLVQKVLNFDPN